MSEDLVWLLQLPLAVIVGVMAVWCGVQPGVMGWIGQKVRQRKLQQGKTPARWFLETKLACQCLVVNYAGKLPGPFFRDLVERTKVSLEPWTSGRVLGEDWLVVMNCHPEYPLSSQVYYHLYDRFRLYEDLEP